jgi:cysteine-rich repeat protein
LDDVSGLLSWNITFGNNSPMFNNGMLDFGSELFSHFHGPAPPGMTAGIKVTLANGSPKVGSTTVASASDRTDIKNDLWYINIHSSSCGGGEIRGQVVRTPTCSDGILDGGEQCDDGNLTNGDCCDSTCQNEPDGQACDDGNGTTINDQCSSGVCSGTPAAGIDHYLCWQYKGDSKVVDVAGAVSVTDQFGTHVVDKAKKAKFMCNPAVKSGNLGDLLNPNAHLVCYGMKPVKLGVPNVTTSDQFLNQSLESKGKAKLLCAPANKS